MNASKILLSVAAVMILAGCSKSPTIPDPEPTDTIYGSGDGSNADTYGSGGDEFGAGGEIYDDSMDPTGGELDTVIYFEFDSSEVGSDYTDTVSRHAMLLVNDQRLTVRLDGHADEQGSREYNIGLGERRAQAVRRLLLLQGASPDQIKTVSFGEERPEAFGSDEESYARNRRVVINYEN
jgi:peptidoglycan-associated lipoprotein